MSVSGGGLCGTLGFLFASGFSPHTGHQLAFTRERKDSVEMIKLINRSNFFLPVFLLKMFFFFNFHFPQGSPKMAELIRIPWLCGLSAPEGPRRGGSGLGGGRSSSPGAACPAEGLCGTPWCVLALGTPSRGRGRPAGPLLGPPGPPPVCWAGGSEVAPRPVRLLPGGACAWGAWGGPGGRGCHLARA